MTLTPEQLAAVDAAEQFARRGNAKGYLVIHGLAGTGKTHTLGQLAAGHPDWQIGTPTNKAATVLAAKSGLSVRTVYSIFLRPVEGVDATGKKTLGWTPSKKPGQLRGSVVLVDEVSMVGEWLARHMLDAGAKIIACGDPGQLPPVAGRTFFDTADVMLTEPHRQAWDSPIIRQAWAVRQGRDYGADPADLGIRSDGTGFIVCRWSNIDAQTLAAADVILCWRNATRKLMNRYARMVRGIDPDGPWRAGEPVMCLTNVREIGLSNGEVFRLAADFVPKVGDDSGSGLIGDTIALQGFGDVYDAVTEDAIIPTAVNSEVIEPVRFALSYAATVHKYQGSEEDRVIVIDEYNRDDFRREWLYTAFTRAKKQLIVVRG